MEAAIDGRPVYPVYVNGQPMPPNGRLVEFLNAAHKKAVEAREARLVAALREVVQFSDTAWGNTEPWPRFNRIADACRAALSGHGDYVPRAELEAERERTRGVWAVLADIANTGGLGSDEARELMRVLGIEAKPKERTWPMGNLVCRNERCAGHGRIHPPGCYELVGGVAEPIDGTPVEDTDRYRNADNWRLQDWVALPNGLRRHTFHFELNFGGRNVVETDALTEEHARRELQSRLDNAA